jgi:hypothetical protein
VNSRPTPKEIVSHLPPPGEKGIKVYVNRADHDAILKILEKYPVPGSTHRGKVSALFRHLERIIVEDWT